MLNYDPSSPLVFNHIPKCAGTSVRMLFKKHFFKKTFENYRTINDFKPFKDPNYYGPNSVIFSHFNRRRNNPIENMDKNGFKQYCTIFRDPLSMAISAYFYEINTNLNFFKWGKKRQLRAIIENGFSFKLFKDLALARKQKKYSSLEEYIESRNEIFLDYLPDNLTEDNYKKYFEENYILLGISENISATLELLSHKINKTFSTDWIPKKNIGNYDKDRLISDQLKLKFISRNKLSYKIYNFAKEKVSEELTSLQS